MAAFFVLSRNRVNADGHITGERKMAKNLNDVVEEIDIDDEVKEVTEPEVEEQEEETTETEEPEQEEQETESETEAEEQEEETDETESDEEEEEPEPEPEQKPEPVKKKEPEKKNKPAKSVNKKAEKKKAEDDTDAELDAFFEKLRKTKEQQAEKEKAKKDAEKTFTQAEFEKALKSALAKRLPSKEEREQFEHWRESQQTLEEKMSVLKVQNNRLTEELEKTKRENFEAVEKLKHENTIIKAGVERDAVEFVQYKVEQMEGDFDENLQDYLKEHKRYIAPKTTIVEAAEHKPKVKTAITKKDLDKMGYIERTKYREEHPEEYAKAMGR